MSVETLNTVRSFSAAAAGARPYTYSIAPTLQAVVADESFTHPAKLELFLEGENPLGCIRGVMWMMAFNAAVFLLGVLVWQSCKFLL